MASAWWLFGITCGMLALIIGCYESEIRRLKLENYHLKSENKRLKTIEKTAVNSSKAAVNFQKMHKKSVNFD